MIGRLWRGWATAPHALAYEEIFRTSILPDLQRIGGFVAAYVLRRDAGEEVEIVTLTLFGSMEAIQEFAGSEPELAHVTVEARQLLSRFEKTVIHYEVLLAP
jgi:heme-degrading monooxygenase HmoA